MVETARRRGLLGRETGRERDGHSGEPLSARARQRTPVRRTRVRDCALVVRSSSFFVVLWGASLAIPNHGISKRFNPGR